MELLQPTLFSASASLARFYYLCFTLTFTDSIVSGTSLASARPMKTTCQKANVDTGWLRGEVQHCALGALKGVL